MHAKIAPTLSRKQTDKILNIIEALVGSDKQQTPRKGPGKAPAPVLQMAQKRA